MDNHFNTGYASYAPANNQHQPLGSFGSLSSSNHQQESPSHTTLPPLQNPNGGYQFGNLSYNHPGNQTHTPTTPHTPATSSMSGSNPNASHMPPTYPQPGSMLPPSSFNQHYSMTQSMQYSSSTATSLPTTSSVAGLPAIRPMPPQGLPSLSSSGQIGQQPAFMQNEEAPTHVVGSQGRRGILPSAPGRPNPPAQGSAQSTKSMIPQKDQDGKFPCPHCNKTYLHAKHLKRHLLRHTGDRPYMCHLCKDTFSRSDILKRHFQKCSIRRGNPTGANHLAHQRRSTGNGNRLSISQQDGPIGLAGLQEVAGPAYNGGLTTSPTVNGDMSARTSRANSMISPGSVSHRNSIAGLGILGSNVSNNEPMGSAPGMQHGLPAYSLPNVTSSGAVQSNYAFNNSQMNGSVFNNQPQQMSFLGQQSSRFDSHSSPQQQVPNGETGGNPMDWNRMFSHGGQDSFIGSQQPANASSEGLPQIKVESNSAHNFGASEESFLGSLYSHPSALSCSDNGQGMAAIADLSSDDPMQSKLDDLISYCFTSTPESYTDGGAAEVVRGCLTMDGIKHYAEHYLSYHGHWPILHLPTFLLSEANSALVLAVVSIGAIYSPRLNMTQTRQMMEFVKAAVMANCSIYHRFLNGQTHDLGAQDQDLQEMQALLMIQSMFTWHGEPQQREAARNDFPTIVRIAKAMRLCENAPTNHHAHSILHNERGAQPEHISADCWDWYAWLEQEKRNRVLYLLFLTDAALAIYFNCTPQLDPLQIRLALPADDAAWDAKDARECAGVLGLFGPQAQDSNPTGSKRSVQPGMREAMRTLLDPALAFQPSSTNVYSKFILIHALVVRIIACQKILAQPDSLAHGLNPGLILNHGSPRTPLTHYDWLEQRPASGSLSSTSSGHGTPTEANSGVQSVAAQQERKRLTQALDKWKRIQDIDIDIQYPSSKPQLRRFGFSRDGVTFFYLGRSFLQSHTASDWTAPADARFQQVMSLLKRIKNFVVGENEIKGQDIGSVGEIDAKYGLDNLTLDMKLLFKSYNGKFDTPANGYELYAA